MSALTAAAGTGGLGLAAEARGAPAVEAPLVRLPPVHRLQVTDPAHLSLAEAATLIREGELSPLELAEAYLGRIARLDPMLMAFNTVLEDEVRAGARALQDGTPHGALWGVPLALKDNFHTAGVRTTANSHIFADFVPERDGEVWRRLRAQGALLLGKTQMGPLATSRATTPDGDNTTLNAWAPTDPSVSPGGSSSGSATAVAARLAAGATGTQTGGSITSPSGAQGLTGLKPTMGRVSLRGVIPLTYTRDHPGPIARDALDAAILLQLMAGADPEDPRTLGLPPVGDLVSAATPVERAGRPALRWGTRIGVLPGYLEVTAPTGRGGRGGAPPAEDSPERTARLEALAARRGAGIDARRRMLDAFEGLGAEIVEVRLPDDWETLTSFTFNNVRLPERSEPFLDALRRDVRLFGVSLSPWINGLLLPGTEYLRGQRAKLLLLRRVLNGLFAQCDVVVQTSPIPFDMIGLPLIAFPTGFHEEAGRRLPLGAILGGQPYAEDRLLSLVAAYQSVTGWHRERPADPPSSESGTPGPYVPAAGERGRTDVWDVVLQGE